MTERFDPPRAQEYEGGIYVIRDVWTSPRLPHRPLARCEYAVMDGSNVVWKPCVEGVMYDAIEPLCRTLAHG